MGGALLLAYKVLEGQVHELAEKVGQLEQQVHKQKTANLMQQQALLTITNLKTEWGLDQASGPDCRVL